MKNDLQFHLDSFSDRRFKISYGLNVRNDNSSDGVAAADEKQGIISRFGNNNNSTDGMVAAEEKQGINRKASAATAPVETVLLRCLQEDLKRLPEDPGLEVFEEMPVETFGKDLLARYGWFEGRGIGKNVKEDVESKDYPRRTKKEGLGFGSNEIKATLRFERDMRENKNRAHVREIEGREMGLKETIMEGFCKAYLAAYGWVEGRAIGKDVRVVEGRKMGLIGTIMEKLDGNWVVLKLKDSEQKVKVHTFEIADLGSKEEEKCLRKLEELKIRNAGRKVKISKRSGGNEKISEKKVNAKRYRSDGDQGVFWLRSHIKVRIISKSLDGGRLYLKKGKVLDVVGSYMCDILMDDSKELIQGVEQELLQAALPKPGGPVLVLYGKHKGTYGSLLKCDLGRETGVVIDADSQQLLNVKLDQTAEYIGDPRYLGY